MTPGRAWHLLFGCSLLTAVHCMAATAAELSTLRDDKQGKMHTSTPWGRLLLAAAPSEVTSPDVAVGGACASDILAHCKHLLSKDAGKAAQRKASLSWKIVQAAKLGHAASKGKGKGKGKSKKGKKPAASQAGAQAAAGTGAATGGAAGTGAAAGATTVQQVHHRHLMQAGGADAGAAGGANAAGAAAANGSGAGTAAAATGTAAAAATGTGAQQTAATTGAATAALGTATGAASGTGAAAAGGAATASAHTATGAGASNQTAAATTAAATTAAANTATTTAAATEAKSAGQGAAGAAAAGTGANGTSTAGTGTAGAAADKAATTTSTAGTAAAAQTAAATTTTKTAAQVSTTAADAAAAAAADDEADDEADDAEEDADAAAAAEVSLETKAALAELNAAESQRDDLSVALLQLGLTSPMTSGLMAIATAPLARWVRVWGHAEHADEPWGVWHRLSKARAAGNLRHWKPGLSRSRDAIPAPMGHRCERTGGINAGRCDAIVCLEPPIWVGQAGGPLARCSQRQERTGMHAPDIPDLPSETPSQLGPTRQVPARRDARQRDVHQPQHSRRGGRVQG